MLNKNKFIFILLFTLIILNSCNKKNDDDIEYKHFKLDSIYISSHATYLDSIVLIEIDINNQSKKDTFWIPISQWELNGIFDKNSGLATYPANNNNIVNYFLIKPKDSAISVMEVRAPGPSYHYFPKLWQIEPKSKKHLSIKFRLVKHFGDNTEFEMLSELPLSNCINLLKLLKQMPFSKDSSMFCIADSLSFSFDNITGKVYPWLDYYSSNRRIDSIYNPKLMKILEKESLRNSNSFRNELPSFLFDKDDYRKWFENDINKANKKIVEESLRDFYSYKIINTFKQSLRSDCVIKMN